MFLLANDAFETHTHNLFKQQATVTFDVIQVKDS